MDLEAKQDDSLTAEVKQSQTIETQDNVSIDNAATIASINDIIEAHSANLEGFDPSVHAVNPDGSPKRKTNGEFARKRGRGAKPQAAPVDSTGEEMSTEQAAKMATNLTIGVSVAFFGSEWEPESKDEALMLKGAYKDYFDAKGVVKLPPELGLVVALGAYSLPRMAKPKTKDKLSYILTKMKSWFKRKRD